MAQGIPNHILHGAGLRGAKAEAQPNGARCPERWLGQDVLCDGVVPGDAGVSLGEVGTQALHAVSHGHSICNCDKATDIQLTEGDHMDVLPGSRLRGGCRATLSDSPGGLHGGYQGVWPSRGWGLQAEEGVVPQGLPCQRVGWGSLPAGAGLLGGRGRWGWG